MHQIKNASIHDHTWQENGYTFTEIIRQEYALNNCIFSAGIVEGHPIDTMYIAWGKDGSEAGMLLMRPDEIAGLAWITSGVLWSYTLSQLPEEEPHAEHRTGME